MVRLIPDINREQRFTYKSIPKLVENIFMVIFSFCYSDRYYFQIDKEKSTRYYQISQKIGEIRSLFRLFKSLVEFKRIRMILETCFDNFSLTTMVLSRFCYAVFYLFDNIYILMKIMNIDLPQLPKEKFKKWASIAWLLGLFFVIIYCLKILRRTYTDESDLKVAAIGKMTVGEVKANLSQIVDLRRSHEFLLTRSVSDFFICLNELNIPFNVVGKRLNLGVEGFLGVISGWVYMQGFATFKDWKVTE